MKQSREGFEQWCRRPGLSDQAKAIITQIRTLPPARHVQSTASNMSGTYPSLKMECAIQFESHKEEIRQIVLSLQAQHLSLTQKQISRYFVQPAILCDPKVREILREVCREIEEESL